MIIKPRVLYITDVMTTYRTMSLNLSLWFLCCKLKIFVKARLTNLFRVIIKFRRREKYMHQLYIYMVGSRGKLNLTNLITEQSLNSELHSSHYNFYNFFCFFRKAQEKEKIVFDLPEINGTSLFNTVRGFTSVFVFWGK